MAICIFLFSFIFEIFFESINAKPVTEDILRSEPKIKKLISSIVIPDYSIKLNDKIVMHLLNEKTIFDPGFTFGDSSARYMYYSRVNLAFQFMVTLSFIISENKTFNLTTDNAYVLFEHQDIKEMMLFNLTKGYSLIFNESNFTFNRSEISFNGLENYSIFKFYFTDELVKRIKDHFLTTFYNKMRESFVHYPVCKSLSNLLLSREKMLNIKYYTINDPDYIEFKNIYYEKDIKENDTMVLTNFHFNFDYHRYYDFQRKLNLKNEIFHVNYTYGKVLCYPERINFLDKGSGEGMKDFVISKFEELYIDYANKVFT